MATLTWPYRPAENVSANYVRHGGRPLHRNAAICGAYLTMIPANMAPASWASLTRRQPLS